MLPDSAVDFTEECMQLQQHKATYAYYLPFCTSQNKYLIVLQSIYAIIFGDIKPKQDCSKRSD